MKHEYQQGDLENIPIEIIERMLEYQVEQGNPRDVTVFQNSAYKNKQFGGFDWTSTPEGADFWQTVLIEEKFDLFFDRHLYPSLLKTIYLSDGYTEDEVQKILNESEIIKLKHRYAGREVLMVVHDNFTVDFFKIGENNSLTLINVK